MTPPIFFVTLRPRAEQALAFLTRTHPCVMDVWQTLSIRLGHNPYLGVPVPLHGRPVELDISEPKLLSMTAESQTGLSGTRICLTAFYLPFTGGKVIRNGKVVVYHLQIA